jgi:hypothetical protein
MLTYSEFAEILEGYNRCRKQQIKDMIYIAWHTAALTRIKEIPSLSSLMQETEKKKVQTDEEMMAMAKILNAAFGGSTVIT